MVKFLLKEERGKISCFKIFIQLVKKTRISSVFFLLYESYMAGYPEKAAEKLMFILAQSVGGILRIKKILEKYATHFN